MQNCSTFQLPLDVTRARTQFRPLRSGEGRMELHRIYPGPGCTLHTLLSPLNNKSAISLNEADAQ